MSAIELSEVVKRIGTRSVLDRVQLSVPSGSLTAVVGASGTGKTTLLRLIAGFDTVTSGRIRIDGETVDDGHRHSHAQHRGIGYVPQDSALFPHLTVAGNIGFGLKRGERERIQELLELVDLVGLEHRRPHQLSGGQQQRVALARALAIRPRVLLLDEPFASLDASLRSSVRDDVARIVARAGTTTILVTHDQDEALSLADQVAVLADGVVLGSGSPRELYSAPANAAIATRLGLANILPAQLSGGSAMTALGLLELDLPVHAGLGTVMVRPEQIEVLPQSAPDAIAARTIRVDFTGHTALVQLASDAAESAATSAPTTLPTPLTAPIFARIHGARDLPLGQTVWLRVRGRAHLLSESEHPLSVDLT